MYRMWKNVFITLEDNRYLLETRKYISVIYMYHLYKYIKTNLIHACVVCGTMYFIRG